MVVGAMAPPMIPALEWKTVAILWPHGPLIRAVKPTVVMLPMGTVTSIMGFPVTLVTMANFRMVLPERGSGRMNHPSRCVDVDAMMIDQRAAENRSAHTDGDPLPAMLLR